MRVAKVRVTVAEMNRRIRFLLYRGTIEDGHISDVPAYIVQPLLGCLTGQPLRDRRFQPSSSNWGWRDRTIHGVCQLPSGYALCTLPPGSHVVELDKDQPSHENQPGSQTPAGLKYTNNKTDDGDDRDRGDGKAIAASRCSLLKTKVSLKSILRQYPLNPLHSSNIQLSSVNNFAKGLMAIFQTICVIYYLSSEV